MGKIIFQLCNRLVSFQLYERLISNFLVLTHISGSFAFEFLWWPHLTYSAYYRKTDKIRREKTRATRFSGVPRRPDLIRKKFTCELLTNGGFPMAVGSERGAPQLNIAPEFLKLVDIKLLSLLSCTDCYLTAPRLNSSLLTCMYHVGSFQNSQ